METTLLATATQRLHGGQFAALVRRQTALYDRQSAFEDAATKGLVSLKNKVQIRVFGIVGWKNSGKTTMVSKLVAELTKRGHKVSTVKHAHHVFDVDHEGTDSYKHRQAGASEVALVSMKRLAIMRELRDAPEPSLDEVLARLEPCDLVLIEGFKREPHKKLEVIRAETAKDAPLWPNDPNIKAIATDANLENCDRTLFAIDAVAQIADFIEAETGLS